MTRAGIADLLDDAVATRRIVALAGLPRVGRTLALRRWATTNGGVVVSHVRDGTGGLIVVDHVDEAGTTDIIERYRADDVAECDTRYVIAPTNLNALHKLTSELTGAVATITMPPVSLPDYIAERMPEIAPSGPIDDMAAAPEPTNRSQIDLDEHWLRGGLPESHDIGPPHTSLAWRRGLIEDMIRRDYGRFGIAPGARIEDVLQTLANQNGGEFNRTKISWMKGQEVNSVLHVLDRLGLTRTLENFPARSSSSIGKMQKIYIRDSGLLHALLGIETVEQLRQHSSIGECWEGYAIEELIGAAGPGATPQFFRSDDGNEIDLFLTFARSGQSIAIECKTNPDADPRPGFWKATDHLKPDDQFIVHSGTVSRTSGSLPRLPLTDAVQRVMARARANHGERSRTKATR
ncbi:MAG TPA: DUF4143 domain-containing protein [Sphingopyxis sp.]|uniref:ATP-binding protein n=1 Tax=Sphingopyxis sp. TaxID=1908224 RepID=UPI002BB23AC6|nr:DUF4143 domain-containing protein [Sphingopyxis sp.]HWW57072.1 DUF4143 domain-containing protein [Sphingopyxis sp.]